LFRKREDNFQHSSYNTKLRSSRHSREIEEDDSDYKPKKKRERIHEAQGISKSERYDERPRKELHEGRVKQRREDFTEQGRLGQHLGKSRTAGDTDPRMSRNVEYGPKRNRDRPTRYKERPESDPENVEMNRRASIREKQRSLVTKERVKPRKKTASDPEDMKDIQQWRTSTREGRNTRTTITEGRKTENCHQ